MRIPVFTKTTPPQFRAIIKLEGLVKNCFRILSPKFGPRPFFVSSSYSWNRSALSSSFFLLWRAPYLVVLLFLRQAEVGSVEAGNRQAPERWHPVKRHPCRLGEKLSFVFASFQGQLQTRAVDAEKSQANKLVNLLNQYLPPILRSIAKKMKFFIIRRKKILIAEDGKPRARTEINCFYSNRGRGKYFLFSTQRTTQSRDDS